MTTVNLKTFSAFAIILVLFKWQGLQNWQLLLLWMRLHNAQHFLLEHHRFGKHYKTESKLT